MDIEQHNARLVQDLPLLRMICAEHARYPHEVDDLVQEACLIAIRTAGTAPDEERVRKPRLRYMGRLAARSLYHLERHVSELDVLHEELSEQMHGREDGKAERLKHMLSCLSPYRRGVMVLWLAGYSLTDIARQRGQSPQGISQTWRKSCEQMRRETCKTL